MTSPGEVANATLQRFQNEAQSNRPTSWVNPAETFDESSSTRARFFHLTGFLHIPAFCSQQECDQMKNEMSQLVANCWNPNEDIDSFGTSDSDNTARGDYFLESAERVHFFAETEAMNDGKLKAEFESRRIEALNKAGHALHMQPNSIFESYCFSPKIRQLVTELGWMDPVVPQSMYIFKQATLGGAVNSHQDSTFLFTTPRQTCLGLWLALDSATLENGCLWVRPKSHREPVRRCFKRNPLHFGQEQIDSRQNEAKGDVKNQPKFVMEDLYEHSITWEGDLPRGSDEWTAILEAGFIPIECKPGDLVAFCGELDHLSLPNRSQYARHTFQLHLVDGPDAGVEWSASNWLQYTKGKHFSKLLSKNS